MSNAAENDNDAVDADLLARNLVIAVSRAVRLSMLHRLENDAIATTAQGLVDAVRAALAGAGGAVVKAGADGVFVNGQLVRPIGEVVESAERLQKHLVRLGVEVVAFDAVPDDAFVRALLAAFQACTPGNAQPLFELRLPGLTVRAPGQGGAASDKDGRAGAVAAVVDVVCALQELHLGRTKKTAALRKALQRLSDVVDGDGAAFVVGALTALDDAALADAALAGAGRGAAVAALVLVRARRAGCAKTEAVALAFVAALALPHASLDDVAAAAALPTAQAPALCALRLDLWRAQQSPAQGFAAVVKGADACAAALARGEGAAALQRFFA